MKFGLDPCQAGNQRRLCSGARSRSARRTCGAPKARRQVSSGSTKFCGAHPKIFCVPKRLNVGPQIEQGWADTFFVAGAGAQENARVAARHVEINFHAAEQGLEEPGLFWHSCDPVLYCHLDQKISYVSQIVLSKWNYRPQHAAFDNTSAQTFFRGHLENSG